MSAPTNRGAGIRALDDELGRDVLVALLNENSFNRRRRVEAVRRKADWAQMVAIRRARRSAA
jgi:hypothetical protein